MKSIDIPLVDDDTLIIDNSSLESFTTCPRQAQYAIIRKLKPAGERVPLIFGGIIHKILEARYRSITSLHAASDQTTNVMLAVAEREFTKWTAPEDDFRNYSCAVELIRRYQEHYPFEQFEAVQGADGTSMVEVPFAIPLGSITVSSGEVVKVIWSGRIDLAYLSENGGGLYVMDHKTTSVLGPSYFSTFEIAHQMYGYAWAVEQLCRRRVDGVVINAIGIRKPTKTGKAFEFERRLIPVSPTLMEEWKLDCLHIIADFLEMANRGYMPKHTAWCVGKFGTCPFHKVCTLDTDSQREVMLQSGEYIDNTWTPLGE